MSLLQQEGRVFYHMLACISTWPAQIHAHFPKCVWSRQRKLFRSKLHLKIATKDLQCFIGLWVEKCEVSATKITMIFDIFSHCGSSQKHEYSLVPLAMRIQLLHFHNTCNSEQSLLYSVQTSVQSSTESNELCSEYKFSSGR